jgi:hypothetical protein
MAIEFVPKPTAKIPLWLNFLFYFSILLLIGTVAANFALDYYQKKSEKDFKNYVELIEMAWTPEQKSLERELIGYEKKINDFSTLIELHKFNSNLFPLLEKNTHPQVLFSTVEFNSTENTVALSCQTESFQTLGEQILILKKEKLIKNINLANVLIGKEGKIIFNLNLSLDPQLFK